MSAVLSITPGDRVLVVAPHPDDETLATGGLLLHAAAAGAAVRVVYFSDGDRNPWAQRAVERRFRIGLDDRLRFAATRRREARAALEMLGVSPDAALFLGLPDQGATDVLLRADQDVMRALTDAVMAWAPTVLALPHPRDLHPDHNAIAVLAQLCLGRPDERRSPRPLAYLVHSERSWEPAEAWLELALDEAQRERKRAAILCHASQLFWRRSWMLTFGAATERFDGASASTTDHPVGDAAWQAGDLTLAVASRQEARAFGGRVLYLIGADPDRDAVRLAVPLPARGGAAAILDLKAGSPAGTAHLRGTPRRGTLTIPSSALHSHTGLFAKIGRRFGFFDEAGWTRV